MQGGPGVFARGIHALGLPTAQQLRPACFYIGMSLGGRGGHIKILWLRISTRSAWEALNVLMNFRAGSSLGAEWRGRAVRVGVYLNTTT